MVYWAYALGAGLGEWRETQEQLMKSNEFHAEHFGLHFEGKGPSVEGF